MTAATAAVPRFPREVRWTVALGLIGLAVTAPFSAPDGTGMQWDEVVLAPAAAFAGVALLRLLRTMEPAAGRPWRYVGAGAFLFMLAQIASAAFPGPAFDGFGIDDVVLLAGAVSPLVTCGLFARRVIRTRWTTLILDGARAAVALFVVSDLLLAHRVHGSAAGAEHSLVLAYGAYAAIILGSAGALCTVSTAALRRSASTMIWANVWMASGAISEALAIVAPSPAWTMASDVTVLLGLQTVLLAAHRAPKRFERSDVRASAPRVGAGGIVITLGAMLGLPLSMGIAVVRGEILHTDAVIGCAVVLGLSAFRVVLRIREDGRVTEDLVRHEEDFRGLVESSSDGVAIIDGEATVLFASPAARALLGITGTLGDGVVLPDLVDPEDRALVRAALEHGDVPVLHFGVAGPDGIRHEIEATSTVRPGQERRVLYLRDVTVRRRRERELERMAYTDHLTALPNRALLFREMSTDAGGPGERSLLVLDLDGFKTVNDVAGHEAGDQLLIEVARRLHTVVREDDLVTRLGGDEFAILVEGTLEESVEVAQRVVDVLSLPHRTGQYTFALGGSVGVSRLGIGGAQVAFREADAALRAAKQAGKGCVRVAEHALAGPTADSGFVAALADGSVRLRMDTCCDSEGRIGLVHALPVWDHPVHGAVTGQEVWAAAERQGASADLQRWLLHRACAAIAALDDERVDLAVSLPAGYLSSEGLAVEVHEALAASGLPAERLVLSVTEETLLASTAGLVSELQAARAAGVRLLLDNYGMGHSLFALLARMPLDAVRVDLTLLAVRDDIARALHVLSVITRTTESFGLVSIVGGITSPELWAAAHEAGADLVQGRATPHDLTDEGLAALLAASAVPTP